MTQEELNARLLSAGVVPSLCSHLSSAYGGVRDQLVASFGALAKGSGTMPQYNGLQWRLDVTVSDLARTRLMRS